MGKSLISLRMPMVKTGYTRRCQELDNLGYMYWLRTISIVLFRNEIWLREKISTYYYCFHNRPLDEASLAGRTDIVNFNITGGGPAGNTDKAR